MNLHWVKHLISYHNNASLAGEKPTSDPQACMREAQPRNRFSCCSCTNGFCKVILVSRIQHMVVLMYLSAQALVLSVSIVKLQEIAKERHCACYAQEVYETSSIKCLQLSHGNKCGTICLRMTYMEVIHLLHPTDQPGTMTVSSIDASRCSTTLLHRECLDGGRLLVLLLLRSWSLSGENGHGTSFLIGGV